MLNFIFRNVLRPISPWTQNTVCSCYVQFKVMCIVYIYILHPSRNFRKINVFSYQADLQYIIYNNIQYWVCVCISSRVKNTHQKRNTSTLPLNTTTTIFCNDHYVTGQRCGIFSFAVLSRGFVTFFPLTCILYHM